MANGYAKYSGIGGGGGSGSVTSVAFADGSSTPIFTITGSPITSTGTITETLNTQSANTVFSGPTTGSAAQPTFRALVAADIPSLSATYANVALSNLSATSINQSLVPNANQTFNLGSSSAAWANVYAQHIFDSSGVQAINVDGRQLRNTSNSLMADFSGANISFNALRLTSVADPSGAQDAATKNYVDTHAGTGITSLTGDITGTGPGAAATTLATVNSNTGSFGSSTAIPNFTVNGKGLITAAGTSAVIAPAGTLSGTTLNSTVVTSSLTALGAQSQALNMNSNKINNVTNPTSAQDAATKNYVDTAVQGINPAVAVQAATTSAANTSGFTYNNGVSGIGATFTGSVNTAIVIDGYTFTALGQRLLVKNDTQSPSGAFNGIYYVTQIQTIALAPILTRALDYDQTSDINNTGAIPVINGTVNGTTQWVLTSQVNTIGTDPLTYAQFSANPSSYLQVANNLSDVANKATAYNNISPMTTTGDIEYEVSTGTAARLGIGTAGQVLQVNAGATAPQWASIASASNSFFASSQVTTTSSAVSSSTFTTFSNSPGLTFTPTITGTYKVYCGANIINGNQDGTCAIQIINTSGSATLLYSSQGSLSVNTAAASSQTAGTVFVEAVYTLTSGTAYQFDLQGASTNGTNIYLTGLNTSNPSGAPFYMFAEGLNLSYSISSSLIGAMVTYGVY